MSDFVVTGAAAEFAVVQREARTQPAAQEHAAEDVNALLELDAAEAPAD